MDILAAGAIVFDDLGRLLMVRRLRAPGAGRWSIPGGKRDPGESAESACVRECAEETGLIVEVDRFAGRVYRQASDTDRFVIDDFACRRTGGGLLAGDDAEQVRWVSREEFAQLDLVDGLAQALADWGLLPC